MYNEVINCMCKQWYFKENQDGRWEKKRREGEKRRVCFYGAQVQIYHRTTCITCVKYTFYIMWSVDTAYITQISHKYHTNIIQISYKYHTNITQISYKYHTISHNITQYHTNNVWWVAKLHEHGNSFDLIALIRWKIYSVRSLCV